MSAPALAQEDVSYTYQRLGTSRSEIRVLIVEPGEEGPIRCRLEHADLHKVRYETVSYVWGDARIRASVYIDGQRLDVPASSEAALRRMRSGTRERTLWMDAIAINQQDSVERSQQVAIMPEIFSHGFRNLVWLGEDETDTIEKAMLSMQAIMKEIKQESENFESLTSILYDTSGEYRYSDQAVVSDVDWLAIQNFFDNPWFSRLWVVQEAALAQESVCLRGRHEIPLRDVLYVSTWLRFKTYSLPFSRKTHKGLINSAWIAELADTRCGVIDLPLMWRLLPIMVTLRPFLASQPHDHIFSLLGLYQKLHKVKVLPRVLTPNYQTSPAETFINATRFAIDERGTLDVLQDVLHRCDDDSNNEGFPTWLPLWHRPFDERCDGYSLLSALRPFKACGGRRMLTIEVECEEPRILEVRGFVISPVAITLPTVYGYERLEFNTRDEEVAWHNEYKSLIIKGQSREDIARSLVGDREWDFTPLETSDAISGYSSYVSALEGDDEYPHGRAAIGRALEQLSTAGKYHRAVWNLQHNRRAFRLDDEKLGTGPSTLQVGDIVAIVHGCNCPVILRAEQNNAGHFRFVGTCYVQGIMYGEAVQAHEEQGEDDRIFRLT